MRARLHRVAWLCVALAGCASATQGSTGDLDGAVPVKDLPAHDLAKSVDLADPLDLAASPDLATVGGCNATNQALGGGGGPDTCEYGQVCASSTMMCADAPTVTCTMGSGAPTWDEASQLAPVITSISATLLATTGTTECANGDPAALVTVQYYSPTTLTTKDSNTEFLGQVKFKKSTSSTGSWFSANFVRMLPPKNQHFGSFQVGINCGGATGVKEAGLYLLDEAAHVSNAVCVSW
ncbi:MAG: hypothetical protein ABI321_02380 [Polyangia bacterium]